MKLFRNHDTSTVTINGIRNNIRIIQHNLCNVVPTSAILEIVSLMDYEEIDFKSDIFKSLQITIDHVNVESVNFIPSKEDQLLDLNYDIRLYRRSGQREAKCINTFYFTGKDNGVDGLKEYYMGFLWNVAISMQSIFWKLRISRRLQKIRSIFRYLMELSMKITWNGMMAISSTSAVIR